MKTHSSSHNLTSMPRTRRYSFSKKITLLSLSAALLSSSAPSLLAQSAYFQAVTNLAPVVYLPLQETNQPPIADVETNLGSLGPVANAIYSSANVQKSQGGATADGDFSVLDTDAQGGFLAVPTTDPRTTITSPTFTVEVWVNSAEQGRNFEGIVAKSGGNSAGIRGANNQGGFCLSQNYIAYLDNANLRGWDFHVYNGVGHEGAEVVVPYNVANGAWYHLVAVYDGTNCWLYVNGTNMVAAGVGYQIPMTGSYVPDFWNQLQIGSSRNLNGNNYHGNLDEVAIYTNVLAPARILAHYNAASSVSPYSATILADNPYMYWRMDAPAYTAPDPSTYPVANNAGVFASAFTGLYGTASQPGVAGPPFAGLLDPSNNNASFAVAINGIGGNNGGTANVPYGYDTSGNVQLAADAAPVILQPDSFADPLVGLLNPTNHAPFSFTIWFKANPHDWSRFQTLVGHSDSGWRMSMNGSGGIQWNPGPGGEVGTPFSYDDGSWHQFIGTYDGSNVLTYVDGVLAVSTTTTAVNAGSPLFPMVGAPPDYIGAGNNYPARSGYNQRLFSGRLAHFAFFTNVLSSAQVQNLYGAAVPNQAPYIVGQPVTGRVNPATNFLFFGVVAGGTPALSYQWYFNSTSNYSGATTLVNDGVKYAGVTTVNMTVSNLVSSDSGYYFVIVTNNFGSVTSRLATLSVDYAPVITAQSPVGTTTLFSGQSVSASVTAISVVTPLSYQWYINGTPDTAGTNAIYVSGPIASAGTNLFCIVTNGYGSATSSVVTVSAILPMPAFLTNATFSSNILALKPTAYWPMHETGEAPAPNDIETNYGSLGAVGNGIYGDWKNIMIANAGLNVGGNENAPTNISVLHGIVGAIAGDPDPAVNLFGANNSWVAVPRTTSATTLKPPFTLEAWVRPNDNQSFGIMVGEDGNAFNATGNKGGFDWLYSGSANTFSITVYNGNGGGSVEPKTTASYPPGQWYHVVTEFDGTNISYWINGVQDPLQNSPAATMALNTWDPITVGCGRGLGNNMFRGTMDEVAVYTNLLPVSEITKHYNDGTNSTYHNYKGDVLADNPLVYFRMDSPTFTPPPLASWPVLTNYGNVGINGVYTPGSVPGAGAGPSEQGVSVGGLPFNSALAQDGYSTFADAGNIPQFHPSGKTPFSVAAWMKGNPADVNARNWQSLVANGDGGWRLNMNGGNGRANFNNNGGSGDIGNGGGFTINDGQWHYVVGTSDGTNTIVYVDGLVSATNINQSINESGLAVDILVGAYPANTLNNNVDTLGNVRNEAGRVLAGSICEASFWDGTALSPNQVRSLYQSLQVAPLFLSQPISATVNQNSSFTNTSLASGTSPLFYQWYENNLPRSGQTNANLVLSSVATTDASADWYVVASNSYGSATSSIVSLTVNSVPQITQQPINTNLVLFAGGHATFTIAASGAIPLHYQWYSNTVALLNATNPVYNLLNAQPPNSTITYYCTVTNSAGTINSESITVSIIPDPTFAYPVTIMADHPVGFWRLNETNNPNLTLNDGVIARDYFGGNDGIYTNTTLGNPGYTASDTNTTSAGFEQSSFFQDNDVYGIPIDFSAPSNSNSSFSIEAWVQGTLGPQASDAGIVNKGYGSGGEQFNLDCGSGSGSVAHSFRFFVRDSAGAVHTVNSTINPSDNQWHHLVGICDEPHGGVLLYIDGELVGTNTITPGTGILSATDLMLIGSRRSGSATNHNDFQFDGFIADVSAYNYALSQAQVLNHYDSAQIPVHIAQQPTNALAGQFGSATFSVVALGTPLIQYQWYNAGTALPIGNATNASLVLNNVQSTDNGSSYYVVVQNPYGTNQSDTVTLTVYSGIPTITADVPANVFTEEGASVSISVTAYGDEPLSYQWTYSPTNNSSTNNLADGGRISGSHSNVLTIANAQLSDIGNYQVIVSNGSGSTTSSVAALFVGTQPVSFNGIGLGWTSHQAGGYSTPVFTNGVLTLTDNTGSESRAAFFQFPQYIGAWKASFTYQDVTSGGADGMCFVLQNDPRGPNAIGGGGGALAVNGITPSFEMEFNIYSPNTVGWALHVNGANGGYTAPGSVNVASGDPINVNMFYIGGVLSLSFTDPVASTSFSGNFFVGDLTQVCGGQTAYVGFTGADGGVSSTQIITNFSFVSLPTIAVQHTSTNTAVINWQGSILGYTLQQNSDLRTTNWTAVTNSDVIVNGEHQVIVPVSNNREFYRLFLP